MRKLGHRIKLEPKLLLADPDPGGRCDSIEGQGAICRWDVLSGIVLSGWESQPHGEGPDGSTQLAKETQADNYRQCRADYFEPTSLQAITSGS